MKSKPGEYGIENVISRAVMQPGYWKTLKNLRGDLILATAHSAEPRTPDEALLLDVDLSILGADEGAFDEYDQAVRAEYAWVPEQAYQKARAQVLRSFLMRERIYHTALFRRRYEEPARANLRRALSRLENG